mmetsp:Transcript_39308/g.76936  ORF Transcript_39308/g.76936 Transcript_39308/m.76936 type:complete len:247 (+) Transcript_39308:111-851(+)
MFLLQGLVLTLGLAVARPPHRSNNVVGLGEGGLLEVSCVGHGDVGTTHALHGSIEVVKGVRLHDRSSNLRPHAVQRPAILDGDAAVGLDDRINDGLSVKGPDAAKVDDFGLDALLGENLSRLHAEPHHPGKGDNRHIGSLPLNLGLVEGKDKVILLTLGRNAKRCAIHQLVLKKHHRVGVPDRRLHEAPGILAVIRSNNLETRAVTVPRSKALRVLRSDPSRGSVGPPENDGTFDVTCRHVVDLGG